MSKLDTVLNRWKDPSFWRTTVPNYCSNVAETLYKTLTYGIYSRVVHGKPDQVMDEEWDNLIILDACRMDTFNKINWLDGDLGTRISTGCVTGDFLEGNFTGTYPDTVFIAGNPHASRLISDRFHAFLPVWQTHWNEKLGTVPPDRMCDAVRDAHERYPNKRIVAHFVQPHEPYIAPITLEKYGTEYTNGLRVARKMAESDTDRTTPYSTIMARYRSGDLRRGEALGAYEENLRFALEDVSGLLNDIDGKTVLSSDHGEMFGERAWPVPKRRIGHWPGVRTTELVEVPWFVPPFEERRTVTEDGIQATSSDSQEEREEKLRSLGYLE